MPTHLRPGTACTAGNARLIWTFEKLGWAHDVRWPTPRRLARLTADR